MRELLPGLFHWSVVHPVIHKPVGSYYVEPAGLVIDPLLPEVGVALFDGHQPPRQVVLTNRHHYRDSAALAEAFGCPVRCCRAGLHEFAHDERRVEGFDFGAEIAPGVTALEVGSICPDDTALHLAIGEGVLAFADGLTRPDGGPLRFVADSLMGDDPEAVRRGLRGSLRGLAASEDFDHLLFAHGEPLVAGGRQALDDFLAQGSSSA